MKPTKIIVRKAPISHNSPAVSKIFSPDFTERVDNDLLKNTAEMIRNTKSTTRAAMAPTTIGSIHGQRAFQSVMFYWIFVAHSVQSVMPRVEIASRTVITRIATKTTPPIIVEMNP